MSIYDLLSHCKMEAHPPQAHREDSREPRSQTNNCRSKIGKTLGACTLMFQSKLWTLIMCCSLKVIKMSLKNYLKSSY
jgi:hypothetical protein